MEGSMRLISKSGFAILTIMTMMVTSSCGFDGLVESANEELQAESETPEEGLDSLWGGAAGQGDSESTSDGSDIPQPWTQELDLTVWYGSFEILLSQLDVTYTDYEYTLIEISTSFTNISLAQESRTPQALLTLELGDEYFEISPDAQETPWNRKTNGTYILELPGWITPEALQQSILYVGGFDENQAVISLATQSVDVTLQPIPIAPLEAGLSGRVSESSSWDIAIDTAQMYFTRQVSNSGSDLDTAYIVMTGTLTLQSDRPGSLFARELERGSRIDRPDGTSATVEFDGVSWEPNSPSWVEVVIPLENGIAGDYTLFLTSDGDAAEGATVEFTITEEMLAGSIRPEAF
jgi:hypothetical protein